MYLFDLQGQKVTVGNIGQCLYRDSITGYLIYQGRWIYRSTKLPKHSFATHKHP